MSNKKLPFEKIFPYFSYRWRYEDGQYSPYAPFSKVNFFPKDPDVEEYFKKGHNTSISNTVESINLNGIDKGGPDVVAVDILYTESLSSTVYILKTMEIPESERGDGAALQVQVNKRSFSSALPDSQLSRVYDNVPLKAKAQEVTANRLMYGNYVHQFDQKPLSLIVGTKSQGADPLNGPHVKGNRTYNVGVVYIDKYGRYGNLTTQDAAETVGEGSSVKTEFTTRFRSALTAKILSRAPEWAVYYRYFIKDVAGEHFNLTAFNVYNDGQGGDSDSDNIYLQFNSSDRNKISDDTVLIPRRHNSSGSEVMFSNQSRHPVLDIENEAPDIVKGQVIERAQSKIREFKDVKSGSGTSLLIHGSLADENKRDVTTSDTFFFLKDRGGVTMDTQGVPRFFNEYIKSQDSSPAELFDTKEVPINSTSGSGLQVVDMSEYQDRLVIELSNRNGVSDRCLVNSVEYANTNGHNQRNSFKIVLGGTLDENSALTSGTGFSTVPNDMSMHTFEQTIKFFKLGLSEEGQDKLKGSFFVKAPREVADNLGIDNLPTFQTEFDDEGKVSVIREINFETEPIADSNIDLYWESSKTYHVDTDHGYINDVPFANCIGTAEASTGKIYLESTKIFDKFNSVELAKGVRVNTPASRFAEETRKAGLIFSGLYNSKTGINELNQFNASIGITKELEPNYGGIQKLFALDTNLIAFAEDKVFRILADKDALFNADDGVNVTATNLVLGQAMVYQGNHGISNNPESFAHFRNTMFFTDSKRGNVLQLDPSNGQILPISSKGMSNFFRDRIGTASKLIGMYDGSKNIYTLSMQGYNHTEASIGTETFPNETANTTIGYNIRTQGWTSRYSFIPESGITMNNKFYTFKSANAYLHNSNTANRNNFYGTDYDSEVEILFNDNSGNVSDFLTLNYEGDSGWEATSIKGDQDGLYNITNVRLLDSDQSGFLGWFLKEGKYHGAVVGTQPSYIIDPNGSVGADGFWPLIQDGSNTQDVSGTKGFFAKVRFKNSSTTAKELFAISTEYYISQS
jgi:hypothetical protein